MRILAMAAAAVALCTSVLRAGDPEPAFAAASMDPYIPIRNSAMLFELGALHESWGGFYAAGAPASALPNPDGLVDGSETFDYAEATTQTNLRLKIRYGFLAGTEAILEVPYIMAAGGSRRVNPDDGTDTLSGGIGDVTMAVKTSWERIGLGAYFGVLLPVGTPAFTNGDGQLNAGIFWNKSFEPQHFQILSNYVFGFDLPAVNRKVDEQHSMSFYLRASGLLGPNDRFRPYLAYRMERWLTYKQSDAEYASGLQRHLVIPGIDLTIAGDFTAELAFPYVLAGSGNALRSVPSGWAAEVSLRYFWYRF